MKKRLIVIAAVVFVVALLAFYLWIPGSAPSGQEQLVRLTRADMNQFQTAFDANVPHIVLLLSPT